MDRTYITFQGANHLVAGTTDEVLQRWEQALAAAPCCGSKRPTPSSCSA